MTSSAASIAVIVATGLGCLVLFQIALASGAPLGRAAWGGVSAQLPTARRIGSAVSAGVLFVAALAVLGRGGYLSDPGLTATWRWAVWVVAAMLGLSTLANLASSSRWERFLMAPVALVLSVLTVILALGPTGT